LSLDDVVERQQASARGAVVSGTKSERCFDFDCDAVRAHPRPIMGAVDGETPHLDWGECGKCPAHPVHLSKRLECQRSCRLLSAGRCQELANGSLVRRPAKMQFEGGASLRLFEHTNRRSFGFERW
jgi:hypothetical protein